MDLKTISDDLSREIKGLCFGAPVTHVYNPLEYARKPYETYLRRYGASTREIVLIGMNPGPWGMAQTGVPFGEINLVRSWLGIEDPVGLPAKIHPKKPVQGFKCKRSEVSGRRLWGWARKRFGNPKQFFSRFFVANYCPLLFIEATGRNLTPNRISVSERRPLLAACDRALRRTIDFLRPAFVLGVGEFAAQRVRFSLADFDVVCGRITHPSPASPKANKGWENIIEKEISALGIRL